MTPHKQQPNLLPLAIGGFVILSAIFSGIIALTTSASFLLVFGWCTVFWVAILIPTLFWAYIIEPRWWAELTHEKKERVGSWVAGFILLTVVLGLFGMFGGDTWKGDGQVNLFPEGAKSKNYRLNAQITVTTKWWWKKEYKIESIDWPDSGISYLANCTITTSNNTCSDANDNTWAIEVVQPPDRPDESQ